jgi:CRISPR/Cas system-associated exonuclease Cas4 (RecB family)
MHASIENQPVVDEPLASAEAETTESTVDTESDEVVEHPLIDKVRAGQLVKSSASVLRAASDLALVTAAIVDPVVLEEKQAEALEKAERRKAQLRQAQATFVEKSKAEAEEQALKLRKLEAEVAAIEGLKAELVALRPVQAQLEAAQTAKQQAEQALAAALQAAGRWRAAAAGLLVLATVLAVALAM